MYKEQFASRLKKAREKTGMSQRDIAKEARISQPAIALYETGKREPDIETIGMLAELYGVSTDWLFGIGAQNNKENIRQERYLTNMEKEIKKEVKEERKKLAT